MASKKHWKSQLVSRAFEENPADLGSRGVDPLTYPEVNCGAMVFVLCQDKSKWETRGLDNIDTDLEIRKTAS
ncbi:hypothetical protein CVS40_10337 [Lucilia cuprina]|nr:hypothetical protein CVS40_10337 [Lucilia cuprina]